MSVKESMTMIDLQKLRVRLVTAGYSAEQIDKIMAKVSIVREMNSTAAILQTPNGEHVVVSKTIANIVQDVCGNI